ncbi:MAG: hypothetical protein RDV48_28495 [Candidatus Eremiobacteraeota bacterium]|nr:hypothetical protein [Candidatus Eremiobacteraeota bacterium]
MRIKNRKSGETSIYLPSDANKDMGIFFVFVGVVVVPPAYWLLFWYRQLQFTSWEPSIFIGSIFVLVGLYLIIFSRKEILVAKDHIKIIDGLFKKSFTITWKNPPRVKLKYDEEERKGKTMEFWETSLVDGKLEYTIERRPLQLLEARALGERVARILECDFIEKDDDGKETVFAAADLDLPFRDRVMKYPSLMKNPVEAPKKTNLSIKERNKSLVVKWGIDSTGILVDIVVCTAMVFLFTMLSLQEGSLSFYQQCAKRGDFIVYYIASGLVLLLILAVLGYRANMLLSVHGAAFFVTIWWIPLRRKHISMDKIEEIRLTPSMRGPRIQIVSDRELISFKLSDRAAARWLSYKMQQYMLADIQGAQASP